MFLEDFHEADVFGKFGIEKHENILCDLVQSESEVRLFGEEVSLGAGKGKGSGTAVVKSEERSEIEGLGIGGISGSGVGGKRDKEFDGSGGSGVGGRGVGGGNVGTFGGQLCAPGVGGTSSFLNDISSKSIIANMSTPSTMPRSSLTLPRFSIDESSSRSRGRSTRRKASHEPSVDRKPASKRHVEGVVVVSSEHVRKAPATARAIDIDNDDDDDNNGNSMSRGVDPRERVRRQCMSDRVSRSSFEPNAEVLGGTWVHSGC